MGRDKDRTALERAGRPRAQAEHLRVELRGRGVQAGGWLPRAPLTQQDT